MDKNKRGEIESWFDNKNIFITGVTGFMGKVLLEKVLRTLPNVGKLYLLVRPKYGVSSEERINKILKHLPLFETVREKHLESLKKIQTLPGDLTEENLGLTPAQLEELEKEVSIVINLGANLKLEADLKTSFDHNTKATQRLIELCLKWRQLQCFMHVSTIFCYPDIDTLEERVYPFTKNTQKIIEALDILDNEMIEQVAPRLISNHTNSYIFSKRFTETLLLDYKDKIPICIVRPSIVTPTIKEPFPGWVDSLNGPVGVLVGAGKGVIHTMICNEDYHAEIVPVDCAVKAMLAAAYRTAKTKNPNNLPVYNLTQGKLDQKTWGEIVKRGRDHIANYPFDLMLWLPGGNIRSSRLIHNLLIILLHYLPAYFVDMMMFLTGNKRFLVRIQNRVSLGLKLLEYFTTKDWNFQNSNTVSLGDSLDKQDKKLFYFTKFDYDIDEYLKEIILGARKYCVKDPLETLPRARRRLVMFKIADTLVKVLFISFIFLYLYQYLGIFCPKFN